jgi:hypothetical protein
MNQSPRFRSCDNVDRCLHDDDQRDFPCSMNGRCSQIGSESCNTDGDKLRNGCGLPCHLKAPGDVLVGQSSSDGCSKGNQMTEMSEESDGESKEETHDEVAGELTEDGGFRRPGR